MIKIFFIIIAVVVCQKSIGQVAFKDSKIYFKNDSIIKGDVRIIDSSPDEILVNNVHLIKIKLIDSLKNNAYKLRTVNIDGNEKLLIVIVEGDSLNLYKEKDTKIFFVEKKDVVYSLEGGKILIKTETGSYNKKVTQYIGVLKYLTQSRPEVQKEADNLEYTEDELMSFVIKYNSKVKYIRGVNLQKDKYFTDKELFFQYSYIRNNQYYKPNPNITPGFYELGIRLYVKDGSRSSVSTSIQYGKNSYEHGGYDEIMQLNFNYMFDFYRGRNEILYVNFRLLDATYLVDDEDENSFNVGPRINLGFGYRYYIMNNINLFVELNQLVNMEKIPTNFSLGFSYIL